MIKNSRQGFIGWFINRAIKGETIELFCGGKQVRDLNFVDDVVEAMLLAAITKKCHGNVYNLSGERASLKQIAETLLKISGKGSMKSVEFPEEREKIDIGDFYGTSEKFQKDSGWYTKIKLLDGLSQTIEYYNKYKDHYLE
jgi:UDP-glucose 4-epimerase